MAYLSSNCHRLLEAYYGVPQISAIRIVDRAKDMILSGGENIASAEIERVLYARPAVLECAAIAVPDDTWGEVPKAPITLKVDACAGEKEILDHCRRHLAGFKVPKSIEFVESLPKGGTGKTLKKSCAKNIGQGASSAGVERTARSPKFAVCGTHT